MELNNFGTNLPLVTDPNGTVRVGETRVTLDSVLEAFKNGATCEEIVLQFPVLDMSDVYLVIGFYLKNRETVEKYLSTQHLDAAQVRQKVESKFPATGIRQRLLKRLSANRPAAA